MNLVYRVFFIFFIFLVSIFAGMSQIETSHKVVENQGIVYSIKNVSVDLINTKNDSTLTNASLNSNIAQAQKTNSNSGFAPNECANIAQKQYRKFLNYIYSKSYLSNKKQANCIALLSEIFPNAP